jgi:SAM-dependent methyltransferase
VQRGSVDTIVTVQCLCSIPGPERVIRDLYPLLKPGGRWIVYEHVRTKFQGEFVGVWQRESFSLVFIFSLGEGSESWRFYADCYLLQVRSISFGHISSMDAISAGRRMSGCCRPGNGTRLN